MTKSENYYKGLYLREISKLEKKFSSLLSNKKPASLYEPCRYIISSGGKRLRPFLLLLSAKTVGAKFSDVYNAALAVEILHNFTLVHDDIMDNSHLRRGKPTLHVKYNLSTAILAGDNLIAVAYHYLLKDCRENEKSVLETFTRGIIEVCEGQSLDKEFETRDEVQLNEYKTMIKKKTAALASTCCSIGAQLGDGTREEIKALSDYGEYLGIAFQIQDDLLDILADTEEFGKPVGGDLLEGKKTFLFLKALENSDGKEKEMLLKVISNKGIRKNQVNKYRELYYKLNVIDETEKEIIKYTNKALKSLENLSNKEAVDNLIWLANSLIKRSK